MITREDLTLALQTERRRTAKMIRRAANALTHPDTVEETISYRAVQRFADTLATSLESPIKRKPR